MNTRSLRLAMWSGPRNISTAMMRSWGNRADTFVSDEPLYAHYLAHTRKPHPGADEIIARYETDWRQVVAQLTGPIPGGKTIWFQKHMTHHLLPHLELDWIDRLTNCFLIRDPREISRRQTWRTPGCGSKSASSSGCEPPLEKRRRCWIRATCCATHAASCPNSAPRSAWS